LNRQAQTRHPLRNGQLARSIAKRRPAPGRTAPPAAASDESLRRRLEASQARGKQLREDNADLRRRLEAAHGEIRRLRALAPNPGG
jgi:hypothetical protein